MYLVFNTIMNVTTQDGQVDCFRNAAAPPGAGRPLRGRGRRAGPAPAAAGQTDVPFNAACTSWAFDRYDTATQAMSSNYVYGRGRPRGYRSIPFRYVWPAELDLMAQLAGMRLRGRWGRLGPRAVHQREQGHVSVLGKGLAGPGKA